MGESGQKVEHDEGEGGGFVDSGEGVLVHLIWHLDKRVSIIHIFKAELGTRAGHR